MKMKDVRVKAKQVGVRMDGKKADVIHRIQEAENNDPCFATRDQCGQTDCCWREDCLPREALDG